MAKKLALVQLLEMLRDESFSHSMSKVPPSMSYLHSICAVPIPPTLIYQLSKTRINLAKVLTRRRTPLVQSMSESVQNALRTVWGRADRYHYRCILQLQNLRQQIVAGAVSGDINSKETRVMHGGENLMLNALRMRQNLASAVESLEDMSHYISQLERWRTTLEAASAGSNPLVIEELKSLYLSNVIYARRATLFSS